MSSKVRTSAAAVVLAAGLASRFGGAKLLAELDGRPLLQHVLDLAARARLEPVIVVLGGDAPRLRQAINWRSEQQLVNPRPQSGLAGSLRLALEWLAGSGADVQRALVLLGDQPRLTGAQLDILLATPRDAARPIVVPRYEDGARGNPVLLERAAWPFAARLSGDRGMSQVFARQPELVRFVDLPGINPDVDTPADLAALQS